MWPTGATGPTDATGQTARPKLVLVRDPEPALSTSTRGREDEECPDESGAFLAVDPESNLEDW